MSRLYRKSSGHSWTVYFRVHRGERYVSIRGYMDRKASERMLARIERLIEARDYGRLPDSDLRDWLGRLGVRRIEKLAGFGLVHKTILDAARPAAELLKEWVGSMRNRGRTEKHIATQRRRVELILEGVGVEIVRDLTPERLEAWLASKREADGSKNPDGRSVRFSRASSNHYLIAVRGFCRWLLRLGKIDRDPTAAVRPIDTRGHLVKRRRAMSIDEVRRLLETTRLGAVDQATGKRTPTVRHSMSAECRYWFYRLAIETGFRAGALRSLTVGHFDLKAATVRLDVEADKGRRGGIWPVRRDTSAGLAGFLAGKLPGVWAFGTISGGPATEQTAKLLQKDLAAAGIDADGLDFHALRHTFGTAAQYTAAPLVHQRLMGHADYATTQRYAHGDLDPMRAAIEAMPGLGESKPASGEGVG